MIEASPLPSFEQQLLPPSSERLTNGLFGCPSTADNVAKFDKDSVDSSTTNSAGCIKPVNISNGNSDSGNPVRTNDTNPVWTGDGYSVVNGNTSVRRLVEARSQYFRSELDAIQKSLLSPTAAHVTTADLQNLTERVRTLSAQLSDMSSYLTAYEISTLQAKVRELQLMLVAKQRSNDGDKLTPSNNSSKRFEFRRRAPVNEQQANAVNATALSKISAKVAETGAVDTVSHKSDNVTSSSVKQLLVSSRHDECIYLAQESIDYHDIVLKNLVDCTVRIIGMPSSVHIESVEKCTVLCGPVRTSVFVSTANACTFVVACQQLRIHSCRQSDFYIYVSTEGGAIIEDTSGVRFAPYALYYADLRQHMKSVYADDAVFSAESDDDEQQMSKALFAVSSKWRDVVDFNYPFSGVRSPNWNVMPEEARQTWRL